MCVAKEPIELPKTRSPWWKEELGGEERTMPENSRPRMNGGVNRERLFWCFPRAC